VFKGTTARFRCYDCGEEFESCAVHPEEYGAFSCRTARADEAYALGLEEPTVEALSTAIRATQTYVALPEERRAKVFQLLFQALVDQPALGDWLLVDVHPRCPKCGSRRSNLTNTIESKPCRLPLVRCAAWANLDQESRVRVVDDLVGTLR